MGEPHQVLNALSSRDAYERLFACCGSTRWAEAMNARRPFPEAAALFAAARDEWTKLGQDDHLEAFGHHPAIGADIRALAEKFRATANLSGREQSGVVGADPQVLEALRDGNVAYRERFGFVFLVCATGKSAQEMLDLLRLRLPNSRESELAVAAEEQAKITRLRLSKLAP